MKRIIVASTMLLTCLLSYAGGLMTNTNFHIAFARMMARGASSEVDAVYHNPAGLVWGHEGWQLSFNSQTAIQDRDIDVFMPATRDAGGGTMVPNCFFNGGADYKANFEGQAVAPVVPAIFATYHKDNWAVGAMLGVTGGGGKATFSDGLPMFNVPINQLLYYRTGGALTPDKYDLDSHLKGRQFVYSGQMNFNYRILPWLSASAGLRVSYFDASYRGHVVASLDPAVAAAMGLPAELVNVQLDCKQHAWGVNPIVGIDIHTGKLTLAAKYEFRTKFNVPNDTKELSATVVGMTPEEINGLLGARLANFADGVKTRNDMPAMLAVAAGYEFTPKLRATVEYHFFDDLHAKMVGDKQKALRHGTYELLAGAEYDINDKFTVSAGAQRTDYGLSDGFQQETHFSCDSYSIGLGAAVNLNENLRLNLGYFWTTYEDYKQDGIETVQGKPEMGVRTNTYSRSNNVIGVGIDYKF